MKFDTPATSNPIDRLRVVGKPLDRIDGPAKTTGTAPYAYERHDVARNQAYGHVLGAGIAKGRVTAMDTAAAKAAPGVLAVVTTLDMPRLEKGPMNTAWLFGGPADPALPPGHRRGGGRDLRAGARRRGDDPGGLRPRDWPLRPRRRGPEGAARLRRQRRGQRGAARGAYRRLRGRLRARRGHARRDLHHAGREPRDDGAARDGRRLGGGAADGLDLQPDDRLGAGATLPRRSASRRRMSGWTRPMSAAASAASSSCAPTPCWRRSAPAPRSGR
jgi:hypothetical protein